MYGRVGLPSARRAVSGRRRGGGRRESRASRVGVDERRRGREAARATRAATATAPLYLTICGHETAILANAVPISLPGFLTPDILQDQSESEKREESSDDCERCNAHMHVLLAYP